jgi:hypothetical protein
MLSAGYVNIGVARFFVLRFHYTTAFNSYRREHACLDLSG